MKLLRLWRTNDSFKLTVMLLALAVYLLVYAGMQAGRYFRGMNTHTEYVCAYSDSAAAAAARIQAAENVIAYSPQVTQNAEAGRGMPKSVRRA